MMEFSSRIAQVTLPPCWARRNSNLPRKRNKNAQRSYQTNAPKSRLAEKSEKNGLFSQTTRSHRLSTKFGDVVRDVDTFSKSRIVKKPGRSFARRESRHP